MKKKTSPRGTNPNAKQSARRRRASEPMPGNLALDANQRRHSPASNTDRADKPDHDSISVAPPDPAINAAKPRHSTRRKGNNEPDSHKWAHTPPALKIGRGRAKLVDTNVVPNSATPTNNRAAGVTTNRTPSNARSDPGALGLIRLYYRQRACLQRARIKVTNAVGGHLRGALGWRIMPKGSTKAAIAANNAIVKHAAKIIAGKAEPPPHFDDFVGTLNAAVAPLDGQIDKLERAIVKLVETLPIWPWCKSQRGFGAMGLAAVIAFAGDPARWNSPEGLYLPLGLSAPRDGSKEDRMRWYRPQARAAMWTMSSGFMKVKGGSPWRAVYDERRKATKDRKEADGKKWGKLHSHRDAMRIMAKAFLLELWLQWTGKAREARAAA